MLYIIFGTQNPTIKKRIKKISKESLENVDDLNFVKFDANDVSLLEIIDEASYLPLGYEKKVIVVENCSFLVKEDKTLKNDKEYQAFINYIKNPNEQTDLILSVISETIDAKSPIVSEITSKGKVLQIGDVSLDEWTNYVSTYLTRLNTKIDPGALYELSLRTQNNMDLLINSCQKLSLYTDHITEKDIDLMVEKPLDDNIFQIYNSLLSKKNDQALKVYRDLRRTNEEPITIISTLAKQFRTLEQVSYLAKTGASNQEIASKLNIKNEKRVAILLRQTYQMSDKNIKEALEQLYNLDYEIKSGLVDRDFALEMFLINFNK